MNSDIYIFWVDCDLPEWLKFTPIGWLTFYEIKTNTYFPFVEKYDHTLNSHLVARFPEVAHESHNF